MTAARSHTTADAGHVAGLPTTNSHPTWEWDVIEARISERRGQARPGLGCGHHRR
ncbi:hypothetical protein AB0C34_17465 [Nocardia sp. NPDC049220]|uniref:hypothetical protein n=1 Tax=Nocardia sp. NPDC049220 TaxID=3155273 RepID=UPI00340F99D7